MPSPFATPESLCTPLVKSMGEMVFKQYVIHNHFLMSLVRHINIQGGKAIGLFISPINPKNLKITFSYLLD